MKHDLGPLPRIEQVYPGRPVSSAALHDHPIDDPAVIALRKPGRTPEAQADIAAARAAPTADQMEAENDSWLREQREARAKDQEHRAAPTGIEVAMQEIDRAAEQALHEHRNAPTKFRSAHDPDCGHAMFTDDCATCHRQPTCCARRMSPLPDGTVWCDTCGAKRIVRAAGDLDAVLSDAALADTPAVREMGGLLSTPAQEMYGKLRRELAHALGVDRDTDWNTLLARASLPIRGETPSLPPTRYEALHRALKDPDAIVLTGPEAERYRALQDAARKAQASSAAARADGAALLQLVQAFCAGLAQAGEG